MKHHLLTAAILALLLACPAASGRDPGDDFGVWYSVGAEKKIDKKWSAGAQAEFRTRNDSRTADRWSLGADASFRPLKFLRISAGYTFIRDNRPEKITWHSDGSLNGWRPSFWASRHRVSVSVTGKASWNRFDFSLRERWQYTYTPQATARRYDFDDGEWDPARIVAGTGKNVLRSRLMVAYNIARSKVDPFASAEIFNAWALEKVRYTVGLEWKIAKKHSIEAAYRFQTVNSADDAGDANTHILSLSYNFKF